MVKLQPFAENGNLRAQHLIAEIYMAKPEPKPEVAFLWLTRASDNDYAPAKFTLAHLYLSGRGTEKNINEAVELLKQSANAGYQAAIDLLRAAKKNGWWRLSQENGISGVLP